MRCIAVVLLLCAACLSLSAQQQTPTDRSLFLFYPGVLKNAAGEKVGFNDFYEQVWRHEQLLFKEWKWGAHAYLRVGLRPMYTREYDFRLPATMRMHGIRLTFSLMF